MLTARRHTLALCCLAGFVPSCGILFPDPVGPAGGSIATAVKLALNEAGKGSVNGNLRVGLVDVYDLGPVSRGDRVIISVKPTEGSELDPTVALFDGNEEVISLNDDVDLAAGRIDSFIDDILTQNYDHLYLAISKFYFDSNGGPYQAVVELTRGNVVPAPAVQVIWLNFLGGPANIGNAGSFQVPAFDAAKIDPAYAASTDLIKAKIVETVRSNFRDTGAVIISSDENGGPSPPFSTIFFGTFSGTQFGVAQSVDQSNRDCCDDGIVFTDNFDKPFAQQPSAEAIAVAIGNVAAHEAGHLLGLNHTADVTDLMDTTGSASTLLADQEFKLAPLSETIFPFGKQNGPVLLRRVVPAAP
jgi:hypothetical protein